ncbi:hypothetical protein [Nocardia kruczakiae]|uniref:hypothetical protein n=1 Tax=Nocardia kruczakiae TaxID=261477 RepID=UPI0007A37CB2|nr:hypothetical protein [Nocardia kruczakiae]
MSTLLRREASGLSEAGYATVATVMGLENVLDRVEGWKTHRAAMLIGADPASTVLLGGSPLRPLAGIEDIARNLITSLDAERGRVALFHASAISDIRLRQPSPGPTRRHDDAYAGVVAGQLLGSRLEPTCR